MGDHRHGGLPDEEASANLNLRHNRRVSASHVTAENFADVAMQSQSGVGAEPSFVAVARWQ